jgi:hypothetical protein
MQFLPSRMDRLCSIDLTQVENSPVFIRLAQDHDGTQALLRGEKKELLVPRDSIARLTWAEGDYDDNFVFVYQLRRTLKAEMAWENLQEKKDIWQLKKSTLEKLPLIEVDRGCLLFVNDKLLVEGPTKTVTGIVQRQRKPDLSASMEHALNEIDLTLPYVKIEETKSRRFKRQGFHATIEPSEIVKRTEAVILHSQFGPDGVFVHTFICKDESTAEDQRKLLEGLQVLSKSCTALNPTARELIGRAKASAKGAKAFMRYVLTPDEFRQEFFTYIPPALTDGIGYKEW